MIPAADSGKTPRFFGELPWVETRFRGVSRNDAMRFEFGIPVGPYDLDCFNESDSLPAEHCDRLRNRMMLSTAAM